MDSAGALKGIKVMIVDDSSTIRRSAEIFLKPFGCEIILAENGFEAMSKIVNNHPDIIFIDITMPRLDGYQACMLIKKNPIYQSIPVIMLSSKDGLFDKARGRIAGSDSYLTKPFTADDLFSMIRNHIA
ncbi:response regulator [Nitrosomonas ureae]|uniref:Response regulator receiver protein n=1 Tax=Nitrosomonas ureae TaxID=44577 RepID=A0A0S3AIS1_9PROT|nr:response regulator [Nitrosomonas ureae]ALQ51041.1 two-component system response regulator [Nitrosomonas ureae]SDT84955.1 response regulator receiver protein [Nitrosomonas ureae]SOD16177.1 response regulator receiver protein [Nitrosomonas ureae]